MKIIEEIIEEINKEGFKFNINEFEVYYLKSFDIYYLNILNDDIKFNSDFESYINEFYLKFQLEFDDASVFITCKHLDFKVKGNFEKKYVLDYITKNYVENISVDRFVDSLIQIRKLNNKDESSTEVESINLEIENSKTYTSLPLISEFKRKIINLENKDYYSFDNEFDTISNIKLNEVA